LFDQIVLDFIDNGGDKMKRVPKIGWTRYHFKESFIIDMISRLKPFIAK
jgi:hypothetical protein